MSPGLGDILTRNNRFPRTRGDEPYIAVSATLLSTFSPHARG